MRLRKRTRYAAPGLLAFGLLLAAVSTVNAQLQFSARNKYPVGTAPSVSVVGDFNGDGRQDLAVISNPGGTVGVLLGNGDGTYQPAVITAVGTGSLAWVAVGDFNSDAKPDLAVAGGSANNVTILLGNGDGTFQPGAQYVMSTSADYVAAADFNGDKKPDLLVRSGQVGPQSQSSISVLLGRGDGTFESPIVTSYPNGASYLISASAAIADFNGDGKLDVVTASGVSNGSITTLAGNGDGTFQVPINWPLGAAVGYLTAGDLNGDGKQDLAVLPHFVTANQARQACISYGVIALLGNGDGTFRASTTIRFPYNPCKVPAPWNPYAGGFALADLNNDGRLDMVAALHFPTQVGGQSDAIWAFLGNGDGTFQAPQKFNLSAAPDWLTVTNPDEGSLPDLAVSNYVLNYLSVFQNTTPAFTLSLTVAGSGSGAVSSSPAVMSCTSSCTGSFASGTSVTLSAAPIASSTFIGWGGACSGTGPCSLTLNGNESVRATFSQP